MDDGPMVLLANAAIWGYRFWYDRSGAKNDSILVFAFSLWAFRLFAFPLLVHFTLPAAIVIAISVTFFPLGNALDVGTSCYGEEHSDHDTISRWQTMRPLIFPCRTTHTRMFPKKHSFSYSYLFVGIPIGWQGSVGSFLSADLESFSQRTKEYHPASKSKLWFSVEAEDHLSRGSHVDGLKGKLDTYLKSEGENPEDYAFTYLISAPRFCGYSFNPVSFWYLYNEWRELKAMILEVNNTFDERRMYFIKDTAVGILDSLSDANEEGSNNQSTINKSKASAKFTNRWPKDFHVSPFNSRKGSYSLVADDPFSPNSSSNKPVDNTVTLSSSKSQAKIIARVFSTSHSIDPSSLTAWEKFQFLASWWWVGFVTFPRIVKEAGLLFFKRKLNVWYRPEVLKDSIGRHETGDERVIAYAFRSLLRSLVSQSDLSNPMSFESGLSTNSSPEWIYPNRLHDSPDSSTHNPIVFKITTPLFYAHLARHSHISEFLAKEILNEDDKTRTVYISRSPQTVLSLFDDTAPPNIPPCLPIHTHFRTSVLLTLRRLTRKPKDNRYLPLSLLDKYIIQHHLEINVPAYTRAVTKLLASDILAFGVPEIMDAVFWLVRAMLCWVHVMAVKTALLQGIWTESADVKMIKGWGWGLMLGLVAVHGWWMVGGFL